jgi:hypothetical protein
VSPITTFMCYKESPFENHQFNHELELPPSVRNPAVGLPKGIIWVQN